MGDKKWYHSRTLWMNALALIGAAVLHFTGSDLLNAEQQVGLLALANAAMRAFTSQGLTA